MPDITEFVKVSVSKCNPTPDQSVDLCGKTIKGVQVTGTSNALHFNVKSRNLKQEKKKDRERKGEGNVKRRSQLRIFQTFPPHLVDLKFSTHPPSKNDAQMIPVPP